MDELEMVIFAIPSVALLSRDRPRILWGFNSRFYGFDLTPFLFFLLFFFFLFYFIFIFIFLMEPHVMI